MKKELKRREFLSGCFKAGAACVVLSGSGNLFAVSPMHQEKPDPKKLEYCGYTCPPDCTLWKATRENNLELKKKAYAEFNFKEKYKIDFDADKVFCYSCKASDKPLGLSVKACTVRQCAIGKGLDCCIECNGLATCDKELWKNFPKLKEHVEGLQKQYKS